MRDQRLEEILSTVKRDGSAKISELADRFEVSTETIRKDVILLEDRGLLTKGHGVARPAGGLFVQHISQRVTENLDEKMRIAKKALEFVPSSGLIFLDSGSTALCLARLLGDYSGLTIITCALNIANELAQSNNRICLTGGDFKDATSGLSGMWASNAIRSLRPDVTFLGTSGVMSHDGPSAQGFEEAAQKELLLANCRLGIVLMDASKLTETAPLCFARWSDVDILITDRSLSPKERRRLCVRGRIETA